MPKNEIDFPSEDAYDDISTSIIEIEDDSLEKFLEYIVQGKQNEAIKILENNSEKISYYITTPGNATNHSKEIVHGTALQIALGAEDSIMCRMLLIYFDRINDLKEASRQLTNHPLIVRKKYDYTSIENAFTNHNKLDIQKVLIEFKEYFKPGAIQSNEQHFDVQILINAHELFLKLEQGMSEDEREIYFCNIIGFLQRSLPAHYAQAYCTGLANVIHKRQKISRHFNLKVDSQEQKPNVFFPLDDSNPDWQLGKDYLIISTQQGTVAKCAQNLSPLMVDTAHGRQWATIVNLTRYMNGQRHMLKAMIRNPRQFLLLDKFIAQLPGALSRMATNKNYNKLTEILDDENIRHYWFGEVRFNGTLYHMEPNVQLQYFKDALKSQQKDLITNLWQHGAFVKQLIKSFSGDKAQELFKLVHALPSPAFNDFLITYLTDLNELVNIESVDKTNLLIGVKRNNYASTDQISTIETRSFGTITFKTVVLAPNSNKKIKLVDEANKFFNQHLSTQLNVPKTEQRTRAPGDSLFETKSSESKNIKKTEKNNNNNNNNEHQNVSDSEESDSDSEENDYKVNSPKS